MTQAPSPTIVLVEADAVRAGEALEALRPRAVKVVRDGHAGLEAIEASIAVVISAAQLPDMPGLAVLQKWKDAHPGAVRILVADHSELPGLLQARAAGIVDHVVSRASASQGLQRVALEALGAAVDASITRAAPAADAAPSTQIWDQLRWTVEQVARARGVIVRSLPSDARVLHLQFVLPDAEVPVLRNRLAKGWPAPVKAKDRRARWRERRHPLIRFLGGLSLPSELYAQEVPDGHAFVALLPWQREAKVTALVGILPGAPDGGHRADVEALHRHALEKVREFPLPAVPFGDEASGVGQPVPEYDWIITDDYAGPDRRKRETTFLNRFVLFGRRRRVGSRIRSVSDVFVDRLPKAVWAYAIAYVVLSGVDTAFTFKFVREGVVREMNPLLRPLVVEWPLLFLATKNSVALAGLFATARLHSFRLGRHLLRAVLLAYALLDVYWLWLLAR